MGKNTYSNTSKPYQYHDHLLRIASYPILAFVIRSFGENRPLGQLLSTPIYYAELFWNLVIVAAGWEANRQLIYYLDRKHPWEQNKLFRFAYQLFLALPLTVIIVVPMIYLWNELIFDGKEFDAANLLTNDFILIVVFTGTIHMVYTFLYFRDYYIGQIADLTAKLKELEEKLVFVKKDLAPSSSPLSKDIIIVQSGKSSIPISLGEIAYISKIQELGCIKTFAGIEYTTSASHEQLEADLGNEMFFRINRQWLANIKAIKKYSTDPTGKLVLELQPNTHHEVSVSKKRALEFKSWIGKKI